LLIKGHPTKINNKAKDDLRIWRNFLTHLTQWIPICPEKLDQPIATYTFVSDVVGFADKSIWMAQIGCGVLGLDADNNTISGYQTWWPREFITSATDNKGKHFGNKTSTLEMIALILPFLLIPKKLQNKHIRLFTDNIACVYGMKDRYVKMTNMYPSSSEQSTKLEPTFGQSSMSPIATEDPHGKLEWRTTSPEDQPPHSWIANCGSLQAPTTTNRLITMAKKTTRRLGLSNNTVITHNK
jgi:hypothetical protein